VNDRPPGGWFARTIRPATFVRVWGAPGRVRSVNNLFVGAGRVLRGPGELSHNLQSDELGLVGRERFDYRLGNGSPAVGAGIRASWTGCRWLPWRGAVRPPGVRGGSAPAWVDRYRRVRQIGDASFRSSGIEPGTGLVYRPKVDQSADHLDHPPSRSAEGAESPRIRTP